MSSDRPNEGNESHETPQRLKHGYAASEITRRLIHAIFEQRLPPGARITEAQLAEAFSVSRTVVRLSMNQMSEIGVFIKTPNIGYTIASPSRREAGMMLELRHMIEPPMVSKIADQRSEADLKVLERHIEMEAEARVTNNRARLVRLTGEFHMKLAEISGNPYLIRCMTELQVLTCLAILVHAERELGCPRDEHSEIVDAIAQGHGERASAAMAHHLDHIRQDLQLDSADEKPDLESAFRWLGNPEDGEESIHQVP
ncbi:GntR family transcriptional regulator [Celeribacter indicus]|uniref:GntR family transcriptional regulator n=2 Tax=Celeribacter indicus TaxID=1208324 RepID=A0A0B5DZA4_9RHOB|nr:GntR family transcriptional regulator [Celeribacter indicus]